MWHEDLFSLARDSVWLDSLNQLPPASLHSLGDNLPGKGFDCFRPSSDAEKDYNRSWFVLQVGELLACIQILTSDGILTDRIFLPVVKKYISAKKFG